MTDLKPCPCGKKPHLYRDSFDTGEVYGVECTGCFLHTPDSEVEEKAVADWNDHPMHDIHRLREVEKDSIDLHKIVVKNWGTIAKLKYVVVEALRTLDCMCNVALDYECIKCEAKRVLGR